MNNQWSLFKKMTKDDREGLKGSSEKMMYDEKSNDSRESIQKCLTEPGQLSLVMELNEGMPTSYLIDINQVNPLQSSGWRLTRSRCSAARTRPRATPTSAPRTGSARTHSRRGGPPCCWHSPGNRVLQSEHQQ